MAVLKKRFIPSSTALLFTLHLLSAFLGERTSGDLLSEGSPKARRDGRSLNSQMGVLASTIGTDAGDGRLLSAHTHGIQFDPPVLDFREQNIGMPRMEQVEIHNPSHSQTLHLNSISGDSPLFHASFFRSKVLKAGESTTFDVIFLAKISERVHTSLYIQTSLGTFDYQVQGVGVPNKFRLRSLLGARIPVNATYSPLISMYNPFNTSLQITEMYSSGGELHLELLTGQPHGSRSLWEIRPYETKAIGKANFFGRMATNHTSFIRIKTNHISSPSIVLPFEVEVLESPSLFLSREILDFGVLKSGESKALPLYVLNSGSHPVHIKSITIVPENHAVEIEHTSILLKPGSKYSKVAMVTFHSDKVSNPKQTLGDLVIRAEGRGAYQVEVPFETNVLHGSLSYEKSKTLFKVGRAPFNPVIREIPLANQFNVPVVLYDVKLPSKAQDFFVVESFNGPFILPPDSEWYSPFSVKFLPSSSDCLFNTTLRLSTNSTYFSIPLHCYDGQVKYSVEGSTDEDTLDYGILSKHDTSSKLFTVHNVNPVEIQITRFGGSPGLLYTTVELISIHPTNQSTISPVPPKPPHFMDVGESAVFRVNITKPKTKGVHTGEILIHTSFDNILHVPVYFKTAVGEIKISPKVIRFEPSFPYGVAEVPVFVENLYQQPMTVTSIWREPADPRFYFRKVEGHNGYPQVKPKGVMQIGTAVFDPLIEAGSESVYLGMGDNGSWNKSYTSATPSSSVGGIKQSDPVSDLKHFSSLWKAWSSLMEEGVNTLNFSYVIKPDIGTELKVPGTATLIWPHLVKFHGRNVDNLNFPATTIGTSSVDVVYVHNPTHRPLVIQPVLLQHYTRYQSVINLLSEQLDPNLLSLDLNPSPFTFAYDSNIPYETDSSLVNTVIQPGDDPYQMTVVFTPKVDGVANTLLLIRNNLTVLDYVLVRGSGIRGVFSINGIQPSSDPLVFEFTPIMMERCEAGPLVEPMKLSRVFTMHNSGQSSLTLYLVGIGAGEREERGFAVLNYNREITIKPNQTKSIEISFSPDFTLSRVSNTLRFKTSSGTELLFPLLAILPHNLLAVCYAMQPRPEWERTIAWLSVPFWICVLVTVVAVVLVQTNFGLNTAVSYQSDRALPLVQATGGQVFDLRTIISTRTEQTVTVDSNSSRKNSRAPETVRHSNHQRMHGNLSSKPSAPPSSSSASFSEDSKRHIQNLPPRNTKPTQTSSTTPEMKMKSKTPDQPPPTLPEKSALETHEERQSEDVTDRATTPDSSSSRNLVPETTSKQMVSTHSQSSQVNPVLPSPSMGSPSIVQDGDVENTSELTTDSTTGIRKAKSINSQSVSGPNVLIQSDSKLLKVEEIDTPSPDFQPPSSLSSLTEAASPTTGVIFAPSGGKKLKGSRKSNSKLQKSNAVDSTLTPSPSSQAPDPPLVSVPLPVVTAQVLDRNHLERKVSESSLKSTDSSESTTSSGDKSDEKEYSENVSISTNRKDTSTTSAATTTTDSSASVSVKIPLKSKTWKLPLAKEPNTGQTVLMAESPEDPEGILNEDYGKKEVGSLKGKSKRKLRQMKKEEKLKKKEKERVSRVREKVEKIRSVVEEQPYSPEQLDYETTEDVSLPKGSRAKSTSSKTESNHQRSKQRITSKSLHSAESKSQLPETDDPFPRKVSKLTDTRDALSPSPPASQALPVPAPSVPSTAIKSSRGLASKPQYEDIISDPFSQNPDRSTYASKKASSRRGADREGKLPVEEMTTDSVTQLEADEDDSKREKVLEASDESFYEEPDSINPSFEDVEEIGASLDPESDESKSKNQQAAFNHSSPHDLAASLLKKMKYKKRPDQPKSLENADFREEDIEMLKQENFKIDEGHRLIRPNTLSPIKDSSLSSPSPPALNEQLKASTLSLDAEPFYPSSIKTKKHSKSDRKSSGQKQDGHKESSRLAEHKMADPVVGDVAALGEMKMGRSKKLVPQPGRTPVSASPFFMPAPSEKAIMERAEFFHQQAEKPTQFGGNSPYMESQVYGFSEQLGDVQEPVSAFRRPREREQSGPFYGPNTDEVMFPTANERAKHDPKSVDSFFAAKNSRGPPSVGSNSLKIYQQQQQQKVPSVPPGYHPPPPPGYGHEIPAMRTQHFEDEFKREQFLRKKKYIADLYRQERAALVAQYAREQARKSAEALNSLSRPPRVPAGFPPESARLGVSGTPPLWDDYLDVVPPSSQHPPPRGFEDPLLVGNHADPRVAKAPYVPSEFNPPQIPVRRRNMSEVSDIGGEIMPSYMSGGQMPTSVGPPNYKHAPGAEYSHMKQQQEQDGGEMNLPVLEPQQQAKTMGWPQEAELEDASAKWGNSGDMKWTVNSSFNSSTDKPSHDLDNMGLGSDPSLARLDLQLNHNQSYVGNTYELFENQSIWSLNNSGSESSNLLSWAMLGAEQQGRKTSDE